MLDTGEFFVLPNSKIIIYHNSMSPQFYYNVYFQVNYYYYYLCEQLKNCYQTQIQVNKPLVRKSEYNKKIKITYIIKICKQNFINKNIVYF